MTNATLREKSLYKVSAIVLSLLASALAFARGGDESDLRAAWFRKDITPAIGTRLAGYASNDVSVAVHDPLYACGLALDNGREKVLLVALDVIGIDACVLRDFRAKISGRLRIPPANVMITCTHNHEGPHTRQLENGGIKGEYVIGDNSVALDHAYMKSLLATLEAATDELRGAARWRLVRFGYYSTMVDENRNRRFTTVDNRASFIPHRRTLQAVATGLADKELGVVALLDEKTSAPLYVIGNYAAHPLAAHAPGLGGIRISADFPGVFRDYIRSETGAEAMFVNGACGDIVGTGDELGFPAARRMGENLAMAAIAAVIDIQRNQRRFVRTSPRLGGEMRTLVSKMRTVWAEKYGQDTISLGVQCLALGDVCFVGVPGELVSELGLEIKWESPFRRTFIAYCATGYDGYISPPNFIAAGGYEPQSQRFVSRDVLKLVGTAGDAMFALHGRLYPELSEVGEAYPDCARTAVVDIPETYKSTNKDRATKSRK